MPGVFDPRALPSLYGGTVRSYRVSFTGPKTPRGFSWRVAFDEVRRGATVFLNGRRIGANRDPYTPFEVDAKGLRPGKTNLLRVEVDGRKNPKMPEAWWNWIGIVRPVHLVPVGRAHISELGTMSDVRCTGPARGCKASLLIDGQARAHCGRQAHRAAAGGPAARARRARRPQDLQAVRARRPPSSGSSSKLPVPAPQLWSPESPKLYSAELTLRDGGVVQQVEQRQVGLRSVTVVGGRLRLNNRPIQLRGASIHEDMPGHGAALTGQGHGHDRRRAEGARRERHALALPAQRGPAAAPRPGRDHGLEPGPDLAAGPSRQPAPVAEPAQARLGDGPAHGARRAQPPRR